MAYQGRFFQSRNREETISPEAAATEQTSATTRQNPPAAESAAPHSPAQQSVNPPDIPGKSGTKKRKQKSSANRTVSLIFYTVYFALAAAIIGGLFFLNGRLKDRLIKYETAQSSTRCEEVFREHFAQPDWAALYRMAGLSDTEYEGSDAFAAYMANQTAGKTLIYAETYAGLSGVHKYLLKLDDETIGYFTLVDQAPRGSDTADWQLGQVRLRRFCGESVTVQSAPDVTVYINGVALTDAHTIRIQTLLSEEYLPAGVRGPRIYTHYVDGLMVIPEVTAADAQGNPLEVRYNPETGIHTVLTEEHIISEEMYDLVLNTARTYALRMVGKASNQQLAKYFDTGSDTYKAIAGAASWLPVRFSGYAWGDERITGYYRHSDNLFSVHVELPLLITYGDASVKECTVDHSFFFVNTGSTWKCASMTNEDIRDQNDFVRLTFLTGNYVIFTNMFAEDLTTLELPTITAPQGQIFTGWYRLDTAPDGSKIYTRVFAPEDGPVINLPSGSRLEPMTLCALFETEG